MQDTTQGVSVSKGKMIALFGGRFDPVHNGHVAIAKEVLRAVPSVDEVWLIPDNKHHWNPTVASFTDRYNMLRIVSEDPLLNADGRIQVSDIGEKVSHKREGMTVTIDIIRALQENRYWDELLPREKGNRPQKNTYLFIAGSDQLPRLSEWHDFDELHMRLPFLIFPRKGYQTTGDLPFGCMWLSDTQFEPIDDSATAVRKRLEEGKSISDLVPKSVEEYIKQHKLYQ